MPMSAKERMLCALQLGKPDHVPATIHQWQPFHLKNYMQGMSDIEAFRHVGLDAAVSVMPVIPESTQSSSWRVHAAERNNGEYNVVHYTIETPEGILTFENGYNDITTWTMEHLIKRDEDIELIRKYRPIPRLDHAAVTAAYNALGDGGIIRSFVYGNQGGCWQDACMLYGTEEMIFATYDKPEWVHAFLSILLEQKLAYIEQNLPGARVDLIETGGGASSNTVISPTLHEEFCMPYDRKMHDAIRAVGLKSVYHTCGGMTKILDLILQNGCDASETLSPVGVGGDIKDAAPILEKFSGKLAMIGGLDQFSILTDGTLAQIQEEVQRLFHAFGAQGGYIMSASDHFYNAPVENLKTYAAAAKTCIY